MERAHVIAITAGVLLGACFGPFLQGDFVWDDVHLIEHNPAMSGDDSPWRILTMDLWGQATGRAQQVYRPVAMLSIWAQTRLTGLTLWPLRLGNMLIHAACVAIFALLLRRFGAPRALYTAAATIVLLHPSSTEPVMWVAGRHDSLATLFLFAGLWIFCGSAAASPARRIARAAVAGCAFALAFLSKEPHIIAPVILAACAVLTRPRDSLDRALVAELGVACLPLWIAIAGREALGLSLGSDQLELPLAAHLQHFASLLDHYTVQLLTLDNGSTISPYVPLSRARAGMVLLGWLAVVVWLCLRARRSRGHRIALLGVLWFSFALSPHVISVPSAGLYGNRYAYLPLFGLTTTAVGLLMAYPIELPERARALAAAGVLLVAGAIALSTAGHAAHWRSNESLFSADLRRDPANGHALYHLGIDVLSRFDCQAALPLFVRASALSPSYARPFHNAAGCLINLGRLREAEPYARRAVELADHDAGAHYNLGVVLLGLGWPESAASQLERCLTLRPQHGAAARMLAVATRARAEAPVTRSPARP